MKNAVEFEQMVRVHQPIVLSTAVRMLGNEADAKDISQEVFIRAYERFDTLRGCSTLKAWLRTVTRNLCLNHLSRYRARWCFFSEMAPDENEERAKPQFAVSETTRPKLDEAECRQLLETALGKLPPAQRIPLILYHFEENTYQEITVKLGVSLAKLKMDLHRGRKALRKKLEIDWVPTMECLAPN